MTIIGKDNGRFVVERGNGPEFLTEEELSAAEGLKVESEPVAEPAHEEEATTEPETKPEEAAEEPTAKEPTTEESAPADDHA